MIKLLLYFTVTYLFAYLHGKYGIKGGEKRLKDSNYKQVIIEDSEGNKHKAMLNTQTNTLHFNGFSLLLSELYNVKIVKVGEKND